MTQGAKMDVSASTASAVVLETDGIPTFVSGLVYPGSNLAHVPAVEPGELGIRALEPGYKLPSPSGRHPSTSVPTAQVSRGAGDLAEELDDDDVVDVPENANQTAGDERRRVATGRVKIPARADAARLTGAAKPPPVPKEATGEYLAVTEEARTDRFPRFARAAREVSSDNVATGRVAPNTPDVSGRDLEITDQYVVPATNGQEARQSAHDSAPQPVMVPAPTQAQERPTPAGPPKEQDDISALMSEILASESTEEDDPEVRRTSEAWYAEVFDETYLKLIPDRFYQRTLKETQFVQDSLGFAPGAEILDLACGFGRHTVELASRGYTMTGLDISRVLLQRALDESRRRSLSIRFIHGDMRDVGFTGAFDAVINLHTSFGYFDDRTNVEILQHIFRALRPGGRFVVEVLNRDWAVQNVPYGIWWDTDSLLLMEEVKFDAPTSRLRVQRTVVLESQEPWEQNMSIRLYSPHELQGLLAMVGFSVLEFSGDLAHRGIYLGACNRHLIILAEKPR